METYLACSKEHGFIPTDLHGIVRYLLSNGHINVTEDNLALMGDIEFHLGADNIDEEMHLASGIVKVHEKLIKAGEAVDQKEWSLDNDYEMEHKELLSTALEDVRIKSGRVVSVRLGLTRIIKVYQTYDIPVDEALFE